MTPELDFSAEMREDVTSTALPARHRAAQPIVKQFDPTKGDLDPDGEVEVWAAGGLVRDAGQSPIRLLVIHRHRRCDWSLPKGKLDRGETLREAAQREVHEETGYDCHVGPAVAVVRYSDSQGRRKAVVYFEMEAATGRFQPNFEVDEIRWLTVPEAAELLSYDHDIELVRAQL